LTEIRAIFLFLTLFGSGLFHSHASGFHHHSSPPDSAGKRIPRIGIFLPLSPDKDGKSRSETALEFYKGMVLANEMCTALDSGIEFHVFDHRNAAAEFLRISREGCLDGLDLMVGPMRQSLIPVMDSLANQKKIPVMNVLTQGYVKGTSDRFFSQQAGLEAIAQNGFAFMREKAAGNRAGIIYGTERTDSILAETYRRICLENGKEVVLFRKVGKNSAANLSRYIAESGLDSVSHLFVPNNENMVRLQLLSAYGVIQGKFPVLISGKWLEASNAELDEYAGLPFYFINPDLPWQEGEVRKSRESNFIARWGNPPGWPAWKGFDLVMMLSRLWYSHSKEQFSFEGDLPSPVFGKYRYEKGIPENQFTPVYKVEQSGIERLSP
jgi:hypothetical protein